MPWQPERIMANCQNYPDKAWCSRLPGHSPGGVEEASVCVCLVCSPLCLQYQVGESCAYENASRTPRDTRNSMQVHLLRGAKRQETAQSARGI